MPVPTLVTDLSTTLASNSPSGSDNVFPSLDDYLRALSGFVASIRDNSGNGWVSPYLPLTYSAGTANGVVYLNGSKVVTTGSALMFDGSNLGLGVTPSAWAGDKALQVNWGSISSGYEYSVNVSTIAYRDNATWKYQLSSQAPARYEQIAGQHRWFTAPSGTAGNAISFTQSMTLDASGNLGVGITSPGARFDASADNPTRGIVQRVRNGASATQTGSQLLFTQNGIADWVVGQPAGTDAFAFWSGRNPSSDGTERARITSGGDFLVGTTTTPSSSNAGFVVANDANGTYLRNACTITTTRTHFEFVNGNGTVGTISTNASATAYNTSSDRRLKEGIAPAADAGPIIDAIEVVQHDWKVGGHTRFGVIAQDLNAVAPEAVSAGDDGDEIEKTWGVDYSKLVPMLIKEIQSLRARVAALEQA